MRDRNAGPSAVGLGSGGDEHSYGSSKEHGELLSPCSQRRPRGGGAGKRALLAREGRQLAEQLL